MSGIEKFVSVFNGSGFGPWHSDMVSFLKANGCGRVLRHDRENFDKDEDLENWSDMNDRAIGFICLRVVPAIKEKIEGKKWYRGFKEEVIVAATATTLARTRRVPIEVEARTQDVLKFLEEEYGKPGISGNFSDFQIAKAVKIRLIAILPKPLISWKNVSTSLKRTV